MRISLLSIEGKTYPLVFSLNAAEQIEDEYIPVTKWWTVYWNLKNLKK